jgi:hypothetical protein
MTRNGKIARLPLTIRDELNQRLLNGEQGKQLVEWLNGLPQVQAVLKATFEGRPITEDNVSAWKIGGYASWVEAERLREEVFSFMDSTALLKAAAKGKLTDRMSLMLAATMAAQMRRIEAMPDSLEKAKMFRELRIGLMALRRSELYAERLRIERVKHPEPGKRKKVKDPYAGLSPRQRIMQKLGIGEGFDGSKNPELTWPKMPENRTGSESIGANRSGSE